MPNLDETSVKRLGVFVGCVLFLISCLIFRYVFSYANLMEIAVSLALSGAAGVFGYWVCYGEIMRRRK